MKKQRPPKRRKPKRSKRMKYFQYMRSEAWRDKRQEAFKHYGRRCEKCSTSSCLVVHHSTYEHLFNEKMEDLMVLCKDCHNQLHRQMSKSRGFTIRDNI